MSIFYLKNLIPTLRCPNNSINSFKYIELLNLPLFNNLTKYSRINYSHLSFSQNSNSFSDYTFEETTISPGSLDHNNATIEDSIDNGVKSSNTTPNQLNSHPTQLYKLVLDSYNTLDLLSLLRYVEKLHDSNISDAKITTALSSRLLLDLYSVDSARKFGYFFRLLEPSSVLTDEFFKEVVNHIYENKIYPDLGYPRVWVSYFKFLGSNRVYHKPLYNDLIERYIKYLDIQIHNSATADGNKDDNSLNDSVIDECNYKIDRVDIGKGENKLNRRFQESVATVIWCLSICNIRNDKLLSRIIKIVHSFKLETSVLIRILWSLSILKVRLTDVLNNAVETIAKLLEETIDDLSLKRLAHINQLYSILKSLRNSIDPDSGNGNGTVNDVVSEECDEIDRLIQVCKEKLLSQKYPQSGKIISKSQKLVSDFLIRANIPHQLEIITPDLLSIDIRIMLDDEMIALEVDGPTHFLRNIENPELIMKTGPCLFKKELLTRSGYKYTSIPFYNHFDMTNVDTSSEHIKCNEIYEGWDNVKEMDAYYKSILMNSDSEKLRTLLSKYL
ncbi:hypothetical protein MACK_001380 [Theileria orientalis]|uniref:RAP domain-containing protein n=1 Tax=Theileria orientalis TaxID=68886 RepID=A0A976QUN4_THEOR|nr:hypothetical protein MACK_001380 [Theileria orientalis]